MKSDLYEKAKAAAQKLLGKDGRVPDFPPAMDKALDTWTAANDAFNKSREDLEAKVVDLQNANDGLKNLGKQFAAKIAKEDFDLDSSSKDDAKKIQQARKILEDYCDSGARQCTGSDKMLDELDKHVIQLGKYKPEKRG